MAPNVEAQRRGSPILSRRVLIQALGGALLYLVILSFLVGYFARRADGGEFDWELASIFGTALGTTLLAAMTGALAYVSSRDVSATRDLAELTREDQARRERPVLLMTSAEFGEQTFSLSGEPRREGFLDMTLRNVGLAPALRIRLRARYQPGERADFTPPVSEHPVLTPDEEWKCVIMVHFPEWPKEGVRRDQFAISGTFLDRSQENEYEIITRW
jgi:hypothetical protein